MVPRTLFLGIATLLLLAQWGMPVAWSADVVIYPLSDSKPAPKPAKRGAAPAPAKPKAAATKDSDLPVSQGNSTGGTGTHSSGGDVSSLPGGTYTPPSSPEFPIANSASPSPRSPVVTTTTDEAKPKPASGSGKKSHTVKKGDDLSGIADKYGVKVEDLRKANKLAKGKALHSGQVLVIPPGGKVKGGGDPDETSTAGGPTTTPAPAESDATPYATHTGETGTHLRSAPSLDVTAPETSAGDVSLRPPSAETARADKTSDKSSKDKDKDKTRDKDKDKTDVAATQKPRRAAVTHKVGEGETLRSICKKFGVDKDVVYKLSGLKSYTLKYGQTLVIRAGDPEPAPATAGKKSEQPQQQSHPGRDDGDDGNSQLSTVPPLTQPSGSSVADSIGADDHAPAPTPAPAPSQPAVTTGKLLKQGIVHTVGGGETLRGICAKYGVPKEQVKELSNLSSYNIKLGQVLRITPDIYEVKKERSSGGGGAFSLFGNSKRPAGGLPIGSSTDRPTSPGLLPGPTPAPPQSGGMRLQTTQDSRDIDEAPKKDGKLELGTLPVERDANGKSFFPQALKSWQKQVIREATWLSKKNIRYCGRFTPPGEAKPWMMDCSNTARLLYKRTTGLDIGRTASDQYYYLHLAQKAWEVPYADDKPSAEYLHRNLRVGDLLFWEHTYKPERSPPITHVMVFLGYARDGQMLMAGSQTSSYGSVGRIQSGGPDIYVFNPYRPSGGYHTNGYYQRGRFIAFGRPVTGNIVNAAAVTDEPATGKKQRREG